MTTAVYERDEVGATGGPRADVPSLIPRSPGTGLVGMITTAKHVASDSGPTWSSGIGEWPEQ